MIISSFLLPSPVYRAGNCHSLFTTTVPLRFQHNTIERGKALSGEVSTRSTGVDIITRGAQCITILLESDILLKNFQFVEEPLVTFELRDKYLLVVGRGKRENFSQMVKASAMIYEKVLQTNCKYLLVDYRDLVVSLNMNEAVNIVKRSEASQPEFKNLVAAATVVGPTGLEFAKFWKHLANQRGFKGELFEDFGEAERWLLEQIEKTAG